MRIAVGIPNIHSGVKNGRKTRHSIGSAGEEIPRPKKGHRKSVREMGRRN